MLDKQVNHSIAFFDVFISGVDNRNLTLQIYENQLIQDFSQILKVLHRFHTRLV